MSEFRFVSVVGFTVGELAQWAEGYGVPSDATFDSEGDLTWYE